MLTQKKLFVLLLALCMMLSLGLNAFAADAQAEQNVQHSAVGMNTGLSNEPVETVQEQLAQIYASDLSVEEKEIAIKKLLMVPFSANEVGLRSTSWINLSVTVYKQETNFYCVPACTKAAMQYITGSSASQTTIAKAIGATTSGASISDARTYINSNQSIAYYVSISASVSLANMKTCFYDAINTINAPPIISTALTTKGGWRYATSGHAMLITGARSDKEQFTVGDPYVQWEIPSAPMKTNETASKIHTAIVNRGNGFIY